jgi:hypothetical protein
MGQAAENEMVRQCCREWHQRILPEFSNNGHSWPVIYNLPDGSAAVESGLLDFENDEILSCLAPTVSLIQKIAVRSVWRMRDFGEGTQRLVSARLKSPVHGSRSHTRFNANDAS